MECYRVTFVSLTGSETDYVFTVNEQMVTVNDVVHNAILGLKHLNIIKDTILSEWDVMLFVELENEPGTLYQISREVPIPSQVHRWVLRNQQKEILQSIVSTVSTTNPQLNDELLSFELDLDLSLTDLSSSTLCDPSDTAIHSGPVSFIQ